MSIAYRPEIDGLRTISVMLVILHHLNFPLAAGGYVGVDVFFVISGYLITSVVAADIRRGEFSIGGFYKRRIMRLAPAYFLVLGVTSAACIVILLPTELLNYFESVIYSIFFSANFYMWHEVGGYFGAQSDLVPLLHLWSLAVEEQFYIFWPLTLWLIFKTIPARLIWMVVGVALLATTAISEWGVRTHLAAAYFLMPTRAFELLMGALLAFLPRWRWNRRSANAMGVMGLALIFYAAFQYSPETLFPGFNAILPCLGAALVLVFCEAGTDVIGRFLSAYPMVFIGKISYPAYLWHWPIIVFLNIYMVTINMAVGVGVIAATLILSAMTYIYIEKPVKAWRRFNVRRVATYGFLMPALSFLCLSSYAEISDGWPRRFPEAVNLKAAALNSYPSKIRGQCNEGSISNPGTEDECILGMADRPVDFLLIGDSHANHFTGMLDVMAKDAGLRGYDITQSNTILLPGAKNYYERDGEKTEYKNFELRNIQWAKLIRQKKYKAVILGGSFAKHYDLGDYEDGSGKTSKQVFAYRFEQAIRLIRAAGSVPVVIKGAPEIGDLGYECLLRAERSERPAKCSTSVKSYRQFFAGWNSVLNTLIREDPGIVVIDPAKVMCDATVCFSQINGTPLYRDDGHLNQIGSELIGRLYVAKDGNPLLAIKDPGR